MRNVPDTAPTAADKQSGAVSHPAARQHGAGPRCRSLERLAFHLKHPIPLFAFDQREWQRISGSCLRPGAPGSASSPPHRLTGGLSAQFVDARHGGMGGGMGKASGGQVSGGSASGGTSSRGGHGPGGCPECCAGTSQPDIPTDMPKKKPKTGNVRIEYSIDFLQKGGKVDRSGIL